ncbi:MAG: hypothetical protein EA397_05535 [Deltaproteobacteria bacterium]|nr:MAG: hypothetical protein EA397_05535 [Deltaproteobacteria bacterium]
MTEPSRARGVRTDPWRWPVRLGASLGILSLIALAYGLPPAPTSTDRCWARPGSCAGEVHALSLVHADPGARILTSQRFYQLPFSGHDPALDRGVLVTVEGTFDEGGVFHLHWARAHPYRPHKVALGGVGLLILLTLIASTFSLQRTPSGLRFVPRPEVGRA